MKPLNYVKLAEICKPKALNLRSFEDKLRGPLELEITNVCIDSRKVTPGCVFFAIKGENHDSHDYLKQVFENGAVCAVISDKQKIIPQKPILLVNDTVEALGRLAKYVRENSSYKVIGLTGSAGKTTTKNIISHVLKNHFKCYSSPKSFNNNIGVPLTILEAPADAEILVSELGSNHPGEIEYLTKIAQPDIAVVTSVLPAHLEGFGSMQAIEKEKSSISSGLKPNGKFFINDSLAEYCISKNIKYELFEKFENIKLGGYESTFEIEGLVVKLPLPGRANVQNAAVAWTVCKNLGISASQFASAVASIKPVDMRMECLKIGKAMVLADCYNANPGSMANALETLYLISQQEKRRPVFVFGRMGELGSHSEKLHAKLGEEILRYKIPLALTIKGDCSMTAQTAQKGADYEINVNVFENLSQLCDNMYKFVKPDDIILVKASRSERFETIVERLKKDFIGQ